MHKPRSDQELTADQLNIVFDDIILSRITFGVCTWSGFLSVILNARIDTFYDVGYIFKYGFC